MNLHTVDIPVRRSENATRPMSKIERLLYRIWCGASVVTLASLAVGLLGMAGTWRSGDTVSLSAIADNIPTVGWTAVVVLILGMHFVPPYWRRWIVVTAVVGVIINVTLQIMT